MSEMKVRRLVRQEWRPVGGRSVEVFVVATASTLPGKEWEETLAASSYAQGEVVGYVELPPGRRMPNYDTFEEMYRAVKPECKMISLRPEWAERVEDFDPTADNDDGDDEPTSEPSDADADITDGGLRDPGEDPADAVEDAINLANAATQDDVQTGKTYRGRVDGVKPYGVFVHLNNWDSAAEPVRALVHKSEMEDHAPRDFAHGDLVVVEPVNRSEDGLESRLVHVEDRRGSDDG
jgi:hypothetical protein